MDKLAPTSAQYDNALHKCESLFKKKTSDYGTAWRILRTSSLTDQIFIKANRIRTLQEVKVAKVDEGIVPEFIGIVNYSLMALVQLEIPGGIRWSFLQKRQMSVFIKLLMKRAN